MHPYVLVPLAASIVSAVLASTIWTRDPAHRANRLATLLVGTSAVWSLCEVVWNTTGDPRLALWLVRLSAVGWVWIGPLALDLFLEITGDSSPQARRWLPALYGAAGTFLAIDWCTPWIHPAVVRTSWGFGYELGPTYLVFYLFTVCGLGGAFALGARSYRRSASPGERSQARTIAVGILVPLVVASLTDGLLPFFGVQLPRLGTASFAFLGVTIAWSFHRFGYSLLAPGAFAREILETLPDGVALLRLDGRIRSANDGLARLAGMPTEQLSGLPVSILLTPSPAPPAREVNEEECELAPAVGRRIPVSVSSSLLRDKQGSPLGLVVVVRDLREVVMLRHRLVTSGRLAAVGELAAGIAHEINNPVAFVRSNLALLQTHWSTLRGQLEKDETTDDLAEVLREGDELLAESLEGVDRAASFVRDVKGFSHAGRAERELADVNQLLESVLRVAAPQLRNRATLDRRFGQIPLLTCAPQEIKQVFLNLVLNAGQALPAQGGTIRLSTAAGEGDVFVTVGDDGCGIAPDALDRIFDPFFTTKPVGEGTGLGLAISYQIVRKHGGDIQVDSEPGKGTVVRVRLPVAGE